MGYRRRNRAARKKLIDEKIFLDFLPLHLFPPLFREELFSLVSDVQFVVQQEAAKVRGHFAEQPARKRKGKLASKRSRLVLRADSYANEIDPLEGGAAKR